MAPQQHSILKEAGCQCDKKAYLLKMMILSKRSKDIEGTGQKTCSMIIDSDESKSGVLGDMAGFIGVKEIDAGRTAG